MYQNHFISAECLCTYDNKLQEWLTIFNRIYPKSFMSYVLKGLPSFVNRNLACTVRTSLSRNLSGLGNSNKWKFSRNWSNSPCNTSLALINYNHRKSFLFLFGDVFFYFHNKIFILWYCYVSYFVHLLVLLKC